jgi:thioredoxin 1
MDPAWVKRCWPLVAFAILAGIVLFAASGLLVGIWPEFGEDMASGLIESVNARNFNEKVLQSEVPVLVYFYADWCGPCQMQTPILEDLARDASDFTIVQVNIDKSPDLANRFQIESIPSLLLFRDGRLETRHVGLADKTTLRRLLPPLSP